MGTRNLTVAHIDGEYKVAQYCACGGQPQEQGMTALTFLRDKMNAERFKAALRKSSYLSKEAVQAIRWRYSASANVSRAEDCISRLERMEKEHPELSWYIGANILEMVQNHPDGLKLEDNLGFAGDGEFCDWVWVVDFDTGTFEAFKGFAQTWLTKDSRFYSLRKSEEDGCPGVIMMAKWNLDALPSDEEFLKALEEADD